MKNPNPALPEGGQLIALRGLPNTRDLGGIQTLDGRKVRSKRLLRSGALATATAEDLRILTEDYQLRTIVDFRDLAEKMREPDPVPAGVRHVQLPVFEKEQKGITRENLDTTVTINGREYDVMSGTTRSLDNHPAPSDDATIQALEEEVMENLANYLTRMHDNPLDNLRQGYRRMASEAHSKEMYQHFLRVVLDHDEGALLYHCAAGKDRVGMGTLYLLTALGVPEERILEDYLYTNACYQDQVAKLTATAERKGYQGLSESIQTLMGVNMSLIDAALEIIRQDHGSVEQYIREALHFSDDDVMRLREKYLE